jgi:ferredoxin-NADP reductase
MEEHIVKILNTAKVTHDVIRFQVEKPQGYSFIPGQATEVSINVPDLKNDKRPFTFTCLNSADYQGYSYGYITEEFLRANIQPHYKNFYLCGPPPMMDTIMGYFSYMGIKGDSIIMEKM